MRLHHRTNGWTPDRTDPVWAERVEREAKATTDAAEAAYSRAQARLARAEQRLTAARERVGNGVTTRRLAVLDALVELRRQELMRLARQMTYVPASNQHRGRRTHRSIPNGEIL